MLHVFAIGNLGKDPVTKEVNGKTVCNFSIACRVGKDKVEWLNVGAWGKTGELCEQYLGKGKKVAVSGKLESRTYEGKDGTEKTAWSVHADAVEFLSPNQNGDEPKASAAALPQPAPSPLDDIPF
jgi:single-strand DNA-binding protein